MVKKRKIIWTIEKRKLSDLKDHPKNPRQLSQAAYKDLKQSFEKFGYVELVAINLDGTILAGHQRCYIMRDLGQQDEEIEVRVCTTQLSDEEAEEYLIRSNKNTGEWDFDLLANNFGVDQLNSWGFTLDDLGMQGDEEIEEIEDIEESCNFNIKCKNMKELELLQQKLDVKSTKMTYEDFVEKFDL